MFLRGRIDYSTSFCNLISSKPVRQVRNVELNTWLWLSLYTNPLYSYCHCVSVKRKDNRCLTILISLACVSSETHNLQRVFRPRGGGVAPYINFSGSTPRNFWLFFRTQKGSHCARRSLQRPWKLGLRIVVWSEPRMFCEESLGKIKFRAFPKRVGPRILSLESVDYFGASEHYWVVGKK